MNSGLTRCIVGLKWAIDTEIYGGISKKTKEFKIRRRISSQITRRGMSNSYLPLET